MLGILLAGLVATILADDPVTGYFQDLIKNCIVPDEQKFVVAEPTDHDRYWEDPKCGQKTNPAKIRTEKFTMQHREFEYVKQFYERDDNDDDGLMDFNDDYCTFFKQFGYLILFLPALPIAALISFFANWMELNGDWKSITTDALRPLPSSAQDIGVITSKTNKLTN